MSDRKLGIINPDETLFSDNGIRRTGNFWDFGKCPPNSSYHKDDSDVYRDVLNMDAFEGKCSGTVFRFGLRKTASKLSETIYNEERLKDLFEMFKAEGHLALTFLKNLAKIEFYSRKKGANHAKPLFSFAIKHEADEMPRRLKECQFMNDVKQEHGNLSPRDVQIVNSVIIESTIYDDGRAKTDKAKYIIGHFYGGSILEMEHEFISKDQAKDLGFIPLVGVAYRISDVKSTDGHTFCALPLPIIEKKSTGLPVHVNGYFALGPDRKDLKWPPPEQTTSNDKEVSWNLFLLKKIFPTAYKQLLLHLKESGVTANIVYNALPDIDEIDSKWRNFSKEILQEVFLIDSVWSDAISRWILPKDAYFIDKSISGHEAAYAFLKVSSFPVACIAEHMMRGLEECSFNINIASPQHLRKQIIANYNSLRYLSGKDRIDLLRYVLQAPSDITSLFGAPILPLEDGQFASPQLSHNEPLFLTSNEHSKDLVPGCEKSIIKTDIKKDVLEILKQTASEGK